MRQLVAAAVLALVSVAQMDAQASASAIYEEFRAWRNEQHPKIRQSADLLDHYRASLKARRLSDAEIEERIRLISEDGQRLETERWNRILTSDAPTFNTQPNAFLVEMIRNLPVGRALDVGMGQGRNAIFLAQQGWQVTGFDPAEKAVALARQQAAAAGIKIEAHVQRSQGFDWGDNRWDLIVATYEPVRQFRDQLIRALRPGGIVVIEAAHVDATKAMNIGGGIVFESNELLQMFSGFRILQYEDRLAQPDFGPRNAMSRVVRLCAQKR